MTRDRDHFRAYVNLQDTPDIRFDPTVHADLGDGSPGIPPIAFVDLIDGLRIYSHDPVMLGRAALAFAAAADQLRTHITTQTGGTP